MDHHRFDLASVDVNALCRASAAAAQAGPGAPIVLRLEEQLRPITADQERLRMALVNMLVNARHAANGEGEVTLATAADGERVHITIADRGVGIGAEDLAHIFDPYFTTKRGGTGLGLPIAKNIIEGLGGTIAVTSTPGRGTEMHLDFPLAANR